MQEFLSELKRRHVHQVAIAYAALAWMALEVADLVFPRIGLPDWYLTFVLLVAALGFPIALVLGWVFDITESGVVRTKPIPASELAKLSTGQLLQIAVFSVLIIIIAFLMVDRGTAPVKIVNSTAENNNSHDIDSNDKAASSTQPKPVDFVPASGYSIGVLPFVNMSGDKNNEYFSDGISEELLNALVNIPDLRVASRTSSFYFKGMKLSAVAIGKRLGVQLLLEGSVRKDGNRVRVTAQLIDAIRDVHIFSEIYDGDLDDIFTLQNDIARQVAAAVTPVVNTGSIEKPRTINGVAYNYYLEGRNFLRQPVNDRNLDGAENAFRSAIQKDVYFVQAYAGLCQTMLALYRLNSIPKAFVEAEAACNRALTRQQKNSSNWEVHLALGDLYRAAGELEKSLIELNIALSLRMDLPSLHISKGQTLRDMGLLKEAEKAFKEATVVNSIYWESYLELANFYYSQQKYDASIQAFQIVLDLEPKFPDALIGMGSAYYMKKNTLLAETLWLRAEDSVRNENKSSLALVYTNLGLSYYYQDDFKNAILMQKKAIKLTPDDHRFHGRLAESYRGAGDKNAERSTYLDAIHLGEDTIAINPSDWESIGLLSLYHANLNEPKLAKQYQAQMLSLDPANPTAYYFASLGSLAIEDYATALSHLESAITKGFSKDLIINDPDLKSLKQRNPEKFRSVLNIQYQGKM